MASLEIGIIGLPNSGKTTIFNALTGAAAPVAAFAATEVSVNTGIAQVPDEPHRTLRDRLSVTRVDACWKCHQRMDELGLAFENFDHFGRLRATETVRVRVRAAPPAIVTVPVGAVVSSPIGAKTPGSDSLPVASRNWT